MHHVKLGFIGICILLFGVGSSNAQSYPSRTLTIIVPSGAGGILDLMARKIGQKISESFNQPVVIENRPGASGIIALSQVARAPADGYTIGIGTTGSLPMNFVARKKMPFHPINDFAHITILAQGDYLLAIHPEVPAQNLQEFIALAKKKPGQITYSSFGPGSASHFFAEAFSAKAGIKMMHVPYKSAPDGLMGLVSGQVNAAFDSALVLAPQLRDRRLRALATASETRSALAPDVPTFSEAGVPGFTATAWYGFFAPAHTPSEIVNRLHSEILAAAKSPEVRKELEAGGLRLIGSTPTQFVDQIRRDIEIYGAVAKAAGIQLD